MKREKRIKRDKEVLVAFIGTYCRENHDTGGELCSDCNELLEYSLKRTDKCPLEPKPRCKNCHVHCYKPEMRAKIKEVMKFSGIYYMKRGRIDWVYKYFM